MTHRGLDQRNSASGEVYDKPHAALYALLAGAEGCGPAARGARLARDDELADFLCRVQEEIVEEAERLLDVRANDTGKRRCQEAALDFVGPRGGGHPLGPLAGGAPGR